MRWSNKNCFNTPVVFKSHNPCPLQERGDRGTREDGGPVAPPSHHCLMGCTLTRFPGAPGMLPFTRSRCCSVSTPITVSFLSVGARGIMYQGRLRNRVIGPLGVQKNLKHLKLGLEFSCGRKRWQSEKLDQVDNPTCWKKITPHMEKNLDVCPRT